MYTQLTLYIRIYVFTYVVWVYGYAYELSAVYQSYKCGRPSTVQLYLINNHHTMYLL